MSPYSSLIGRKFEFGFQDCYSLIRDFYKLSYDIELPNYARPRFFWEHGMNLYMDRFAKNGFSVLDCHPSEYQLGDVAIMAIQSSIGNHAGVLVENGQLLHHFTNRLSEVVPYRGLWGKNSTLAVLRHKDVVPPRITNRVTLGPSA